MFQWLRLCASSGRDNPIPGQGTNIPPAMPSQENTKEKKNDNKKKDEEIVCV